MSLYYRLKDNKANKMQYITHITWFPSSTGPGSSQQSDDRKGLQQFWHGESHLKADNL